MVDIENPTLPIFLLLKNPALTLLNSNFPSIGGGHVKGQNFPPPRVGIFKYIFCTYMDISFFHNAQFFF